MKLMIEIEMSGGTALINEKDADLLEYTWWISNGYVSSRINGKFIYMHRIIMSRILGGSLQNDKLVDHINRNPLDNRRTNLRSVTHRQSTLNRGKTTRETTSKYIGVSYISGGPKRIKRWRAYIKLSNGKQKIIGYFHTEKEAAIARDKEAKKVYGEYGSFNNV